MIRPATPLPWELNSPALSRLLSLNGIDEKDAAYIIHAANSYLLMVKELHALKALLDMDEPLRALLRELGEL